MYFDVIQRVWDSTYSFALKWMNRRCPLLGPILADLELAQLALLGWSTGHLGIPEWQLGAIQ
jgi:hypothetical protein